MIIEKTAGMLGGFAHIQVSLPFGTYRSFIG